MMNARRSHRKVVSALARFDHRTAILSGQPCCYSSAWLADRAAKRAALVAAVAS